MQHVYIKEKKMTYVLGTRSKSNLKGVHPDLVKVVERAITLTTQDFTVIEGVRTTQRQQELYAQGRTKPGSKVTNADGVKNKSNHQAKADGYGHAVDIVPYPVDWNTTSKFRAIADAMKQAAKDLDVKMEWGGDWTKLVDLPHFEVK